MVKVRMKKKYHSIMRRVVTWPLVIMLFLSAAVFTVAMINYNQTKEREVENYLDVMNSASAQLSNVMKQCEFTFTRYFANETSAGVLRSAPEGSREENYLEAVVDSIRYVEPLREANEVVDGIFLYYPNLSSLNFRGSTQREKDIHDLLSDQLTSDTALFNQWHILDTGEDQYIVYILKNGTGSCGCWMNAKNVLQKLGLDSTQLLKGEIYFADYFGENTMPAEELHGQISMYGPHSTQIKAQQRTFDNYTVLNEGRGIYLGLLVSKGNLFGQMPLPHKVIFTLAFLGFAATIAMVLWMNTRISKPVMMLKDAMERFGNGEVEYRLPENGPEQTDEFEVLGHSLNTMMDKLNDLEFSLYETKLREQDIQLKYISQQIRPHFILNALNVIYTYREDEFPLVKKMVVYLVNYFRYIVNLRVDFVRLEEEFRHVENYLKIQRERTQNQIDFFVEWEQAVSDILIPPLILQTFVENSIKYAVSMDRLYVIVQASEEDGKLIISISDTGQGFSEEALRNISRYLETREDDGSLGVGIVNTVERMDLLYHGEVQVSVENSEGGGACTRIALPLIRQETDN